MGLNEDQIMELSKRMLGVNDPEQLMQEAKENFEKAHLYAKQQEMGDDEFYCYIVQVVLTILRSLHLQGCLLGRYIVHDQHFKK